jgi:hypothetical protein
MLAARYENLSFRVDGLARARDAVGDDLVDAAAGSYQVHVGELGVNAWIMKHVRITANYVFNYFDGDAKNLRDNLYYRAAGIHELTFRLAAQL